MPLRLIPDETKIPFMRYAPAAFPASLLAMVASLALFFVIGLNLGIDFKGGTLIEIQTKESPANLAEIRSKISALGIGSGSSRPTRSMEIVGASSASKR